MYPEIARIGPFALQSFGLVLAIAFLLCGHLFARELARRGMDPDLSGTVVTWAVVGSLLGARLYYLVENWREVRGDLFGAIFSGAGLVAYGGFAGGIAASWLALRARGVPVIRASDAAAPLLLLGYGIGRIGCFFAGDGDYGPPSDLPWAMSFPNGAVPTVVPVHPTPLYEVLMIAPLFVLLWRLRRRSWPDGRLFALYLVVHGVERLLASLWRTGTPAFLGLNQVQAVSILIVLVGLLWLGILRGRSAPSPST